VTLAESDTTGAAPSADPPYVGVAMKKATRLLIATAFTSFLLTAAPIPARWSEICGVANRDRISILKPDGQYVRGYCISVDVNEMTVETKDRKVVRIARSAFRRIYVHQPVQGPLRALGSSMRNGLTYGTNALFSPKAPAGIVTIPAVLAWGAIAAPFCLLGELRNRPTESHEITIIE